MLAQARFKVVVLNVRAMSNGSVTISPIFNLHYSISMVRPGGLVVAREWFDNVVELMKHKPPFPTDGIVTYNPYVGIMSPTERGYSNHPNAHYFKHCPVLDLDPDRLPPRFDAYASVTVQSEGGGGKIVPGPPDDGCVWEVLVGGGVLIFLRRRAKLVPNDNDQIDSELIRPSIFDLCIYHRHFCHQQGVRGQLVMWGCLSPTKLEIVPGDPPPVLAELTVPGEDLQAFQYEVDQRYRCLIPGVYELVHTTPLFATADSAGKAADVYLSLVGDLKTLFNGGNGIRLPLSFLWDSRNIWCCEQHLAAVTHEEFMYAISTVSASGLFVIERDDMGTDWVCAAEAINGRQEMLRRALMVDNVDVVHICRNFGVSHRLGHVLVYFYDKWQQENPLPI